MLMVQICQDFGWTYQQYIAQPAYFIALIREKMRIDGKRREKEINQMKRG